jgi:hypothetical protein
MKNGNDCTPAGIGTALVYEVEILYRRIGQNK